MLQGERIVDALLFGEAWRMGSTPPRRVIAVGIPPGRPSVATSMTASPFCKSERVAGGMRLIACCKSGEPFPAGLPIPADSPDPGLPARESRAFGFCGPFAGLA